MAVPAQPKLQYKFLGRTGLKVSEICFGAMVLGNPGAWNLPTSGDEENCFKMYNRFAEFGGNFIDTADAYGNGSSEEILGKWLKTKNRDDYVIATKVHFTMGSGPNDGGLSRKHILSGVEASLKRLQTNYIDLYQLHSADAGTPLEETLITLNDLVRAGKVRYIGASNFNGAQLQKAIGLSKHLGLEIFSSLQPQYNLLERHIEWDLLQVCKEEGLGVLPWSPLKGGWLTGKYTRDKKPEAGSRIEWAEKIGWEETSYTKFANEQTWNVIDTLVEVAKANKKEPAQIALKWVMQKPGITCPIIGARTLNQLESNLGVIGWQLSAEDMKKLDTVSALELPYPWNLSNPLRNPARIH